MSDDIPEAELPGELPPEGTTRRRALMLGAVGASAIISIRPALAQTQASILTCEIPVPDPGRAGSYIAADGTLVPAGTPGAFAPAGRPFKGQDVKTALSGGRLPGTDYETNRAYTNYIRRLQSGTSGFTCFASLQMPRG
ncbi:hypothetical protein G4G27_11945 [Sphingomonas sp. So64.6b]|uniref:hypothetical protein n=1 Tax=Sphingomonas sp. So64.6b TaxID=2997354 RepID=UPI001601E499|nr:hypothetical protein [Sphingomonas sp. So64.6b]QNA84617.1 hypothetical protein G4G27_11945 [Sphingomonas sp. So64.6b]